MIQDVIAKLVGKESLKSAELKTSFLEIMEGNATPPQIAAFLTALRIKGESSLEMGAAVEAMREKEIPFSHSFTGLVDTCGTGGDGAHTFNVSTTAALIAAAAGAKVAKHGNRSVSSASGSADVLEALGIKIDAPPETIHRCIEKVGFGFLFAPLYHPAMKAVAEVRRQIKVRSIFNLIGPLVNPARVPFQLVGVSDSSLLQRMGEVLKKSDCRHALVVHGEGLDEITLTGKTQILELKRGRFRKSVIDPKKLGFKYCRKADLQGGTAEINAKIVEAILKGEKGPRRDISVLNAAAVLYVCGIAASIREGIPLASQAIDSGKSLRLLEELRRMTHSP